MALEYVIAGRRRLPGGLFRFGTWSWMFEIVDGANQDAADFDPDAEQFEEGACAIDEIKPGQKEFWSWVEKHVGFKPGSVVTVRKAGWEFSQAAAEVLASSLDGVYFVDGTVEEDGLHKPLEPAEPAGSLRELQRRIELASTQANKYFSAWAAADRRAQQEADRRDPAAADQRRKDNDWSDL